MILIKGYIYARVTDIADWTTRIHKIELWRFIRNNGDKTRQAPSLETVLLLDVNPYSGSGMGRGC